MHRVNEWKYFVCRFIFQHPGMTFAHCRALCIGNDNRMNITIPCDMNDRKCLMMQKCIIGHFCVNGGRGSHLRNTKQIPL